MARSNKAEHRRRIEAVFNMLLRGVPTRSIIRAGVAQWKVSSRQIEKYISFADQRIEKIGAVNQEHAYNLAIARLNMLLNRSLTVDQDTRIALQVVKEINLLRGLYKRSESDGMNADEFAAAIRLQGKQMEAVTLGYCKDCKGLGCAVCESLSI